MYIFPNQRRQKLTKKVIISVNNKEVKVKRNEKEDGHCPWNKFGVSREACSGHSIMRKNNFVLKISTFIFKLKWQKAQSRYKSNDCHILCARCL